MASVRELLEDLTSGDETRAEGAAVRLAESGQDAIPMLLELLSSGEPDHRWWALRALSEMKNPDSGLFRRALADPSSEVRAAATLGLVAHPDMQARAALIRSLADDDHMVATLAGRALTLLGSEVVPALIDAFDSAPPRARIVIMRALADLKDHRAIPLMLQSTEAQSAAVGYWAKVGLENLGLDMVYIHPE